MKATTRASAQPQPASRMDRNPFSCEPARTITDAVGPFLVHLEAEGRSPATLSTYRQTLLRFAEVAGSPKLRDVSADQLDLTIVQLAGAGPPDGRRRSPVTLNRIRSTIRSFLRWAQETGKVTQNPAAHLRRARAESVPTIPIEPAEVERLLAAIRGSSAPLRVRDEALFAIYAFTGLRRAEALHLTVGDHDPERRTLLVRSGKGHRPRLVPVPPRLASPLSVHRAQLGASAEVGGPLFPGRLGGEPLTARQAQGRFDRWKVAAGLRPSLTLHSFRAGFATRLHGATGDLVLVSRALGHGDLRTTLRYIQVSPTAIPAAIRAMFA